MAASDDPLTSLGYRKTSVLLKVKGAYGSLQAFLRRMEALTLLVHPSDLSLQALATPTDANAEAAMVLALTQLKLRLSFFDHSSEESKPPAAHAGQS